MRTPDAYLTRKAMAAWPKALVTVAVEGDERKDYQLQRQPGAEIESLGSTIKQARERLKLLVKERLNAVALRWQALEPLVREAIERRRADGNLLQARFIGRTLRMPFRMTPTGPEFFVVILHDDDLVEHDLRDIAERYATHWETHAKNARTTNA